MKKGRWGGQTAGIRNGGRAHLEKKGDGDHSRWPGMADCHRGRQANYE